jgi:hypothetical protein
MPADGTASAQIAPTVRLFPCDACKVPHPLKALNEAMLCEGCGEADEDEDCAPSEAYLRRWESTI